LKRYITNYEIELVTKVIIKHFLATLKVVSHFYGVLTLTRITGKSYWNAEYTLN